MSKHRTRKATAGGRAETIRRKKARKNKYASQPLTLHHSGGEERTR